MHAGVCVCVCVCVCARACVCVFLDVCVHAYVEGLIFCLQNYIDIMEMLYSSIEPHIYFLYTSLMQSSGNIYLAENLAGEEYREALAAAIVEKLKDLSVRYRVVILMRCSTTR